MAKRKDVTPWVGNADKLGFPLTPHEGFGEGRGLGEWQRDVASV